jgi:hypothetical protein
LFWRYLSFPDRATVEVMPHKKRSTAERTESSQNRILQSEKRVKNSRIRIERANTKRLIDMAAIEAKHEKKAAIIEEMKADPRPSIALAQTRLRASSGDVVRTYPGVDRPTHGCRDEEFPRT